jgi:hypothetical protein
MDNDRAAVFNSNQKTSGNIRLTRVSVDLE